MSRTFAGFMFLLVALVISRAAPGAEEPATPVRGSQNPAPGTALTSGSLTVVSSGTVSLSGNNILMLNGVNMNFGRHHGQWRDTADHGQQQLLGPYDDRHGPIGRARPALRQGGRGHPHAYSRDQRRQCYRRYGD